MCFCGSGPHMTVSATSSSVTICAACSKHFGVGTPLKSRAPRLRFILRVADGELGILRFARAACLFKLLHDLFVRRSAAKPITQPARRFSRLRPARGVDDFNRVVWKRED